MEKLLEYYSFKTEEDYPARRVLSTIIDEDSVDEDEENDNVGKVMIQSRSSHDVYGKAGYIIEKNSTRKKINRVMRLNRIIKS